MSAVAQGDVRIRVITEASEWDAIEPHWTALFEASPQAAPPLQFHWMRTWWRLFGPVCGKRANGLRIITAWRGTDLIGVFPLYERTATIPFLGVRQLSFISTGEAWNEETSPDYLDVLCKEREESTCLKSFGKKLRHMQWEYLDLLNVEGHSPLLAWQGLSSSTVKWEYVKRGVCPIANLQGGFETYLTRLSSNGRQNARRLLRSADRAGAVIELAEQPSADSFFDDLVLLHQKRWNSEGKSGSFSTGRIIQFHRELLHRWIPTGEAILARLRVKSQTVAVLYGFITRSKFDFYQSGIQLEDGLLASPGIVSHLLLMSRLAGRGVTHYDFLLGSSSYKDRLATESTTLYSIHSQRRTERTMVQQVSRSFGRSVRQVFKAIRPQQQLVEIEARS